MGASADTLETFFHFKHITCASHRKKKTTSERRKRLLKKKQKKTNQEEAGNESNSCITSNTPSSKLHNIKNQAQSEFPTSNTSQHWGDTAEPCPHSEAQHAPTLLFIFILCRPLLLSLGYLLPQSNTALWVRGGPGGNTHNDFLPQQQADRTEKASELFPPECLSDRMHSFFCLCVKACDDKGQGCKEGVPNLYCLMYPHSPVDHRNSLSDTMCHFIYLTLLIT